MTVNLLMNDALEYAARGWHVFPVYEIGPDGACSCAKGVDCDRPGKHPRTPQGLNDASAERATVENWWTRWPAANIGIATGRVSKLTVIDADAAKDKPGIVNITTLAAPHGGLPSTLRVKTGGGGLHLYFQFNDALNTGANVLAEAVDVRNDGGYVIAPPSNHASGGRYEWANGARELAALPEWMRPAPPPRERKAKSAKRHPKLSIEEAAQALPFIDAADRDKWLAVGVILGREYNRAEEAWALYETWAARSEKFDEHRAENLTRMREHFHDRSQEEPRTGKAALSIGSLIKWAKDGGWEPVAPLRDADHYQLAQALVEEIATETGEPPVYAMGALWLVEDGLWRPMSMEAVAVQVGRRFGGGKLCKRGGDFNSVARIAAGVTGDDNFFAEAEVGIAAPAGFWKVTSSGEIQCEPLTAAHRQRMRVAADPVLNGRPERLLTMLAEAFADHEPEQQTRLLQQLCGCALTRSLWRHRIAVLLLGVTSSGKSTCLHVLRTAFPRDQIAATTPERWDNEYYAATLAGRALNIVGELDAKRPIPAGAFKSVTGRDVIEGRHPTHRPFSFVCEAAHFFNSNRTPPTTDHSDAFFRRWRVLYFAHTVPAERERRNLDEEIVAAEFGEFLGWALEGAATVARDGAIMETETHRHAVERWRVENNSALAFLFDATHCALEQDATTSGQDLFDRYKGWAVDAGMRPFGRTGFYDALAAGGAIARVKVARRDNQVAVEGVRLVSTAGTHQGSSDPRGPF